MSDYQAPTPVWAPADLGGFVLTTEHLDDLGLTETLRTDLLRWQAFFDDHHPVELCGWDSPLSCEQYAGEGFRLQRELARALPGVRFDLDLWPVRAVEEELADSGVRGA